jgi:hypothetical protein
MAANPWEEIFQAGDDYQHHPSLVAAFKDAKPRNVDPGSYKERPTRKAKVLPIHPHLRDGGKGAEAWYNQGALEPALGINHLKARERNLLEEVRKANKPRPKFDLERPAGMATLHKHFDENVLGDPMRPHGGGRDFDRTKQDMDRVFAVRRTKPTKKDHKRDLPEKQGMKELQYIVAFLPRAVKFMQNLQSEKGANDWIIKNGYTDSLYVDSRDYDGDGVGDIIVRKKSDGSPYIVKGYTTVGSDYPIRAQYYKEFPTAKERKGAIPFSKYADRQGITEIYEGGLKRTLDPLVKKRYEEMQKIGYDVKIPKEKIPFTRALHNLVFKPIVATIKNLLWDEQLAGQLGTWKIDMDNKELRKELTKEWRLLEQQVIFDWITYPALVHVYGGQIENVTNQHELKYYINKKEVKQTQTELAYEILSDHDVKLTFGKSAVEFFVQYLQRDGFIAVDQSLFVAQANHVLQNAKEFNFHDPDAFTYHLEAAIPYAEKREKKVKVEEGQG